MTDALSKYLKDVEERVGSLTRLPYKKFPMIVMEYGPDYVETEKSRVMNECMRFGYKAPTDISTLLEMLRVATEALDKVARDELAHPWTYARDTLDKITALCPEAE
jgi:hypothetical protein